MVAHTVEHQIIRYIKCSCFSRGRNNSWKFHVVEMDRGDSPFSSSANIKSITSVVVEKKQLHLKLGWLWKNPIIFYGQRSTPIQVQGMKY